MESGESWKLLKFWNWIWGLRSERTDVHVRRGCGMETSFEVCGKLKWSLSCVLFLGVVENGR